MNLPPPYLLTWMCYGTWLHGDDRTSVEDSPAGPPTRIVQPHEGREDAARGAMVGDPFVMNAEARRVVDGTIREHCAFRGWNLHALNVRTNHVHVVVDCRSPVPPERAMEQFKAWSTRRLREAGLVGSARRVWTEHGSTRWLNTSVGFEAAVRCVRDGQ
ncbi:MAG: transposase [Phycisphaerales bacterium]|nr:transposase [Phycisphaerales bacterium]